MSRGNSGCVPVVAKYREQPIHRRTVTRSAHMTEVTTVEILSILKTKLIGERMLKTDLGCKPGGLVQFDGESDPPSNGINTR